MLHDAVAISIIQKARQKNVANPNRPCRDFERIFTDFFAEVDFAGRRVLDLGPGQYDFARIVAERGGETDNIDKDPAVVELGRYLGYEVSQENLADFDARRRQASYDGLFCKFAINAFWFYDEGADHAARQADYVQQLDAMLKPGGWGWIAPWNGSKGRCADAGDAARVLRAQAEAFSACGWQGFDLSDTWARHYGVDGAVANHALFIKGLEAPPHLAKAPALMR